MMDIEDCPEAQGPVTEPAASYGAALDFQALHQGSIRLPQLDPAAAPGSYVPLCRIPDRLAPEVRERERADDARRYEVRLAAERAAIAAGQSALEAAGTTDKMLREAREIAVKVAAS